MIRKFIISSCFIVCFAGQARSQFIFDFINLSFGMFQSVDEGGYEGRVTWYNNSPATLHGLKGVWQLGERFKMGYSIHYGNNVVSSLMNKRYRMYTLESGMFFEFIVKKEQKWFVSVPLNFSVGTFYIPPTYVPSDESNASPYFAFEPRVQFNKPVFNWLMVSASGGYRIISAQSLYGSNNQNLSGPSLNFSLMFGNFK